MNRNNLQRLTTAVLRQGAVPVAITRGTSPAEARVPLESLETLFSHTQPVGSAGMRRVFMVDVDAVDDPETEVV